MSIKEIKDFSLGYATDLLPDDVPDNMLQAGINVYYKGKLRKRRGYKTFSTDATAGAEIVGHFYCSIEGRGVTIKAVEISSVIKFYSNYSGSFLEIDASFPWTGTGEVRMDVLNQQVVLVDASGVNDPAVIYYDSAMVIETLDAHDIRVIEDAFWFAGQYVESTGVYADDTTNAQSADTADFEIATAVDDGGFYVSGSKRYSKIVLKTAAQMAGSPVAEYAYYDGSAWQTFTPGTVPTWTAAAGDRAIEYEIPTDWAIWEGDDSVDSTGDDVPGGMTGAYIIRVRFTTAPTAAVSCAYLEISQTKAVTTALSNEIPTDVLIHNSRVFLVSGNSINYGLYGLVSGFEPYYAEYFSKGGAQINAVKSMDSSLYVIKDEALHRMTGTNPEEFFIEIIANSGTTDGRSCAVVQGLLCFSDGDQIFLYTGSNLIEIGSHIATDIPATAYGMESGGLYWLISSSQILVIDPENLESASSGESYAATFKFTNTAQIKGLVKYVGSNQFSDTKLKNRLVGYASGSADLICLEYGEQYVDETDTIIPVTVETKMYSFGLQTENKIYKRVKPLISQSGAWTFTIQTRRDADTIAVTIASGTAGTYYEQDISMPYTVDSETLSFKFYNSTVNDCTIYAVSVDVELRPY